MAKIIGAGGGGKGGSSNARKPDIQKDSVASVSTLKILYGLSEGEVEGFATDDPRQSIYLEGTPLADTNGNNNFSDVSYAFVEGTNEQDYIKGFPSVSNESSVNVELKQGAPFVKALSNTQLSAARVRLRFGRLAQTNGENGDVTGTTVKYAIDLQTDGGVYENIINAQVSDKASAGYERTHRIDLPKSNSGWQIRVRRLTPNSDSDLLQNDMYIDAVAEVIDAKLRYPNTAMLGLEYDAETFQNVAKIAVHLKGKRILVPSNYNAQNKTYNGIWDGTFKEDYSNNPAWVYYDLLTQWRYGLGERIDASMIDKWSLYQLGQYCDELVDDGQGGKEPRFECNVYLQKQADAFTVLSNIAGIFRAMSYWNGEQVVLDADIPQDPVYTFSRANVVEGTFNYTGSRARDRHTLVKVAWDNPANNYKTEYEFVRDEQGMAKYGVRVLDLSAFGCTSQAQAQRAGIWALKTEQLETRQVSFSVGLDGFIPQVGNIINVSDEIFAGRANGGRVSKINGVTITLDREVDTGDTLVINGSDGKLEKRTITAIDGNKVTVNAPFDKAESQNIWAIESADLMLMRFRVMSITQNEDMTFDITALQHEPQKYDAVDYGVHVEPTPITIVNPDTVSAPNYVNISSTYRIEQGQTVATLVIDWQQVKDAVAYDVEWRKDDGSWIRLPRTSNISVDIEGVYSGNYQARVRSISAFDVSSQPKVSDLTAIKGKAGKPPKLAKFKATGVLFGIELSWTFAKGSDDTAYTEVQVATAPDTNVSLLGQYAYETDNAQITGLQPNLTQYYRARIVDKLGNKSDWTKWTSDTTDANADKVLDILSGQITESQLHKSLSAPIKKIDSLDATVSSINNQLPSLNTQISQAKSDIEGAIRNVGKLQQQTDEQKQKVSSLTAKQNRLSSDIEQINTTIVNNNDSLSQQINSVKTKADKANSDITQINQSLSDAKQSITTTANSLRSEFRDKIDSIEVGGRNLLRNSGEIVTTSNYLVSVYDITNAPDDGDVCTVTIKGKLGADRQKFAIFNSNSYIVLAYLNEVKSGVWSATFNWTTTRPDGLHTADNSTVRVYQLHSSAESTSTIYSIKLEIGTVATDWTPAPEDVQADIAQVATESNANIDELRQTVTNADSALSTRIDSLDASYKQADNTIKASVQAETKARTNADSSLSNRINALDASYKQADSNITSRIASEEQARASADSANASKISTLESAIYAVNSTFSFNESELVKWHNYRGNGELSIIKENNNDVLQIGNNANNDQAWLINNSVNIPVEPGAVYKVSARVKQVSGGGRLYFGVAGVSKNGSLVNTAGGNYYSSQHYVYGSSSHTKREWVTITGFIAADGVDMSNYAGINGGSTRNMHPDVAYMRPLILANYKNKSGKLMVEWLNIQRIDSAIRADLSEFKQTQASKDNATAQKVQSLQASLSSKASTTAVNQLSNRVTQVDGKINAESRKVSTLQTTVDSNTASVRTQQQSINGLSAQSVLTLDVNGYVTGVGSYNDGKKGSFAVRADEFWIGAPDGSKKKGFVYYASPQTINGVRQQEGLYLDTAFIAYGSINMLHIADSIQSDNFVPKKSGWRLYKNGELEINGKASDGSRILLDNKGLTGFYADGTKAFELGILI